ncbi:MAG: WYL domain-containing protein, partial [Bacteroidia bacterium]
QQIVTDNEQEFKITLDVIPSYELKSQILSYGDKVKVIAPTELKDELKQTLQRALKNY